jgi:hypothetical protein
VFHTSLNAPGPQIHPFQIAARALLKFPPRISSISGLE